MELLLTPFIIIAALAIVIIIKNVIIVPQANAYVIERLGAYHTTWETGIHVKIPIIDRVAKRVSLKEAVVDFPPQPVITKDNVTMQIDTVVFFQITDPKLFAYGVERPMMAIENLTAELNQKTQRIEELQTELASKNIRIQELDAAVTELTGKNNALVADNQAKQQTMAQQDKTLNAAWFVFGTKKELKEQNILTDTGLFKKGKVMEDADVNLNYFTKIDIRTTTEIPLYSKSVEILTSHPEGSYFFEEDAKEQKVLKITNPAEFWSISKYLVIQVK